MKNCTIISTPKTLNKKEFKLDICILFNLLIASFSFFRLFAHNFWVKRIKNYFLMDFPKFWKGRASNRPPSSALLWSYFSINNVGQISNASAWWKKVDYCLQDWYYFQICNNAWVVWETVTQLPLAITIIYSLNAATWAEHL